MTRCIRFRSVRCQSFTLVRLFLFAFLLSCVAAPAVPAMADEKLPDAAAVLDRFIEVCGGPSAFDKLHNRLSKGKLEIPGFPGEISVDIYQATPNKQYLLLQAEQFGKLEEGSDGDVVWRIHPQAGPRIEEGEQRIFKLRTTLFDDMVHWREYFKKAECVGMETVKEKTCYKLVMTPHQGRPERHFFDKETGHLVKLGTHIIIESGTTPIQIYPADYREVDGVLLPHSRKTVYGFQASTFVIDSIEHNIDLPADRFDLPEVIQKLQRGELIEPPPAEEQAPAEDEAPADEPETDSE